MKRLLILMLALSFSSAHAYKVGQDANNAVDNENVAADLTAIQVAKLRAEKYFLLAWKLQMIKTQWVMQTTGATRWAKNDFEAGKIIAVPNMILDALAAYGLNKSTRGLGNLIRGSEIVRFNNSLAGLNGELEAQIARIQLIAANGPSTAGEGRLVAEEIAVSLDRIAALQAHKSDIALFRTRSALASLSRFAIGTVIVSAAAADAAVTFIEIPLGDLNEGISNCDQDIAAIDKTLAAYAKRK